MYMLILNFTYPLRCLRVPPVEYHWSIVFVYLSVGTFNKTKEDEFLACLMKSWCYFYLLVL
jgi:hypothetical protein